MNLQGPITQPPQGDFNTQLGPRPNFNSRPTGDMFQGDLNSKNGSKDLQPRNGFEQYLIGKLV